MYQNTSQQATQGDNMSDYTEGWNDGYKYAREELIEKLREIPINDIDSWLLDKLADMIEGNSL